MKRSKKLVLLAHCILNVNSKVVGLAQYAGALEDLVCGHIRRGSGLIQLPCPETTFLGLKRWGMTREQYDTPFYRSHCRNILQLKHSSSSRTTKYISLSRPSTSCQ